MGLIPAVFVIFSYMGDKINQEFEEYQQDLETRSKKLKLIPKFEVDESLEDTLNGLKGKQIEL